MKPTKEKIISDLGRLSEMVEKYGDESFPEEEKTDFSTELAYVLYEIRRKYELISRFYTVGEISAIKKYDREYNGDK